MTPEQAKILEAQHQQWLQLPTTQQLFRLIDNEEKKQVELIASLSSEYNEFTSSKLERYAMRLKTIQTIRTLAYDTQTFVAGTINTSK